jgi:hypothetical protein
MRNRLKILKEVLEENVEKTSKSNITYKSLIKHIDEAEKRYIEEEEEEEKFRESLLEY